MHTNDMTQGRPLQLILRFALPMLIGNVFQQVYNIVDTMAAGYILGDNAIAAIGATTSLYGLLVNFAMGLNSGCGIVVARSFGAKDRERLKRSVASMIILDAAVTTALTLLSLLFLRRLMAAMNVPAGIFSQAYAYISVIVFGMAMTVLYNLCSGILQALGNSRTPLYFLIFSSLLNLALDLLFVAVFGWGVRGAAAATIAAQAVSGGLCGVYLLHNYRDFLPSFRHFRIEGPLLREMAATGASMAVMLCVVDLGSVFYQRAINDLGSTLITAHTAARKIIGLFMMPLASLATANSTFVSQNWGAGKYRRIRMTLRKVLALQVLWGVFSCVLVWLLGGKAVIWLTNTQSSEVLSNAVFSIRLHFLFYPALGILLAQRTALQAMGEKVIPVCSSSLELLGKLAAGLWLIPRWGYLWVCLTEPIVWSACMLFLALVFLLRSPLKRIEQQKGKVNEDGIL